MALKRKYSISKLWEEYHPVILAFLFSFMAYILHFSIWLDFNIMLDSILITSSIFVGFLGTSIGIIFSADSDRIKWLKQKKEAWAKAISFFKIAFSLNFLLCITSFLFKSITFGSVANLKECAFIIIVFNTTAAFLSFKRAIYIFFLMLSDTHR